ncbi:DUF4255 domain-containing protein [Corallincola holothuriorum]|uniref:DUF4255 domain-containing protein n=1 Tax=Corallincola holothuriorum TaxID=2282215 RepID=A0A368NJ00_9GAMM|nr:DUF4255 domain-containing protein [Corallincola holothuriorum]RCU50552.1 DUF4255 domain-containing protein [Corallincola holothuriorum]
MIADALEYIRREVREYLSLADTEVTLGHAHELKDIGSAGVRLTLVSLAEESALRNQSHTVRTLNSFEYQQPPVLLNLFLLISFDFSQYETSLLRLSQTVERFQSQRYFDHNNASDPNLWPAGLERLVFDLHNVGFEQLNQLWGVLGGSYYPSILYKVRLVKIQAQESVSGPEITSMQVNTRLIKP